MQYDQVVKELLEEFLPEFFELFYPDIAAQVDWTRTEFLDKEVFTDIGEGSQRTADLVARLHTRQGTPEVVILHQEAQRQRGGNFPFRVFEYWSLLRRRYRLPVLSVVLYLAPGARGIVEETYTEELFGRRQLTFDYLAVGLPDLNAPDYENLGNPLGPTLSAMMRGGNADRVERKLQIFGSQPLLSQNDARRERLINFVNLALPFDAAEEAAFEQRLQQGQQEVTQMLTIYEQRGLEQGLSQGLSQGVPLGQQDLLLEQMQVRFGAVPQSLQDRVRSITDTNTLKQLGRLVLTARTLEEMGLETAQ